MATKANGSSLKNMTGALHDTSIDIPVSQREQVIALCNRQLANTFDLYSQTKQAHWNVKGIHFGSLHLLFDQMAEAIFPFVDTIAERATALGGTALGTARMASQSSELPEFPSDVFEDINVLRVVIERWAQYAASVRAAANEADEAGELDTSDMFVDASRVADKMLWFAEAHLQA